MQGNGQGYKIKQYRGSWCIYWREATPTGKTIPRRASLRAQSRAEAEQQFKDFLIREATAGDAVADIFEAYLRDKEGSPGHATAQWNWKALQPSFSHLRDDQVDRPACRAHTARRRAQGIGDNTILRELQMLRAALRWHKPNTPAIFEMPQKPPPRDRHLTRDEYGRLLAGAVAPHVRLFIVLALATGARAAALLELTWDRVDLDRGLVRLAKGGESRNKGRATIPITDFARAALTEARTAALSQNVIEYGGKPVADIKKGIARAASRAQLKDVSPHVLRHTAAVWMAEARVPMSEIAQYLGHSDTTTTERVYARYSPDFLRGAANALEVHLPPKTETSHQAPRKRAGKT